MVQDSRMEKPPVYTAAALLDHMDWMNDGMVQEELACLWPRLDNERGRILWRSFADTVTHAPLKCVSRKARTRTNQKKKTKKTSDSKIRYKLHPVLFFSFSSV